MNAAAILDELRSLAKPSYKKVLLQHGVPDTCYGVKIEDLQKIRRRIKKDYQLALDLYDTGIYDAQYLAGLIADDARMTKADLQHWLDHAVGGALSTTTVPSVAVGGSHGFVLAREWIDSNRERVAAAGWATCSTLVAVKPDAELDLDELRALLRRVERELSGAPNTVRYAMNGFVIASGCFVAALTTEAKAVAERLGRVEVDMGNTACVVPFAPDYIRKVEARGSIGKKRKSAKC